MKLFFRALQFEFATLLAYPHEIFVAILRQIIRIALLIYFWRLVAEGSNGSIDIASLAGYFLIADGVATILMAHNTSYGRAIRKSIKNGTISSLLSKPLNVLPYLYGQTLGRFAINYITGIATIVIGILFVQPSLFQIGLFLIALIPAWTCALVLNLLEGTLSFLITEVGGVKNAIRHVANILSGRMIPLYLFPAAAQPFLILNPFSITVFVPVQFLLEDLSNQQILTRLAFGYGWAIILFWLIMLFWRNSLKHYEAVGI